MITMAKQDAVWRQVCMAISLMPTPYWPACTSLGGYLQQGCGRSSTTAVPKEGSCLSILCKQQQQDSCGKPCSWRLS